MAEYNFIDHTADIAVEVTAETFEDLFKVSAEAWKQAVLEKPNVNSSELKTIEINADSIEELLVNFLSEINYLFLVKKWIFSDVKKIKILFDDKNFELTSDVGGENLDLDRHVLREEIKAVTFHQMIVKKEKNKYTTKIIFDI